MDVLEIEIPGLRLKPYGYANKISKFDLSFYCQERVDGLVFTVEYCTKLFRQDTIKRFTRYFKKIVSGILNNQDIKIGEIEFISGAEKRQVLVEFNETRAEYPKDKVIHVLFEEQVGKTPTCIAVAAPGRSLGPGSGQDILQLSYEKLNQQSDKLARLLRSKGVRPNEIVGIMVERSVEMMVGIMSILKSGGAYLPLDPQKPESRSRLILQNSNTKLLLTGKPFSGEIDILCEVICFTDLNLDKENNEHLEMFEHSSPADLAYLIYTSGSTGTPRGVMIEHRSVLNRLHWMQRNYPIGRGDVILQKTPFDFDVSVWELFWWSFQGASLFLLWPGDEKDPEQIVKAIETHHITTIHFVPSMLNIFLNFFENGDELRRLGSLKRVFSSGEALGPDLVEKFYNIFRERDRERLVNLYGPTEATIDVSYFNCSTAKGLEKVPIGKPIDNIRLFVLDNDLMLLPVGICGELHISGLGLARGYLNQVELTKERFLKNPFFANERLYCTGDLARWLADGDLEFLGRIDHQVKIRGFRVELGEIESHLLNHDNIGEAVVLAGVEGTGDQYLCAYIVSNIEFEISELREYLSKDLPDYMIPTYFMQIEKIPLTPNGKIDRRALPAPELKAGQKYIAPGNAVEEKLSGLWAEVLGVEKHIIGIDSNFFEWGGQSLKAVVLAARMHKTFNIKVPLAEIFKRPTIRGLSRYIEAEEKERHIPIEPAEEKEYYVLSSAQKRLYVMQRLDEKAVGYNIPMAVVLEGEVDKRHMENTFRKLIRRHGSLRTSFELIDEEPVQRVRREVPFEIEYYDAAGGESSNARSAPCSMSHASIIEHFVRPFNLSHAPLLRVGLIKDENMIVDMHHIITDGISIGILIKEFMKLYANWKSPVLRIQYKDFSEWQNNRGIKDKNNNAGFLESQEAYWLKQFVGEIPRLNLPTDFPRTSVKSFEGGIIAFEIDEKQTKEIRELLLETGTTSYMVLLAVYTVLLSKYSFQEDIVVGTAVAGRRHADLENVIGIFVNMLPMRNCCVENQTFREFLAEVKKNALNAFENQDYQFDALVEKLGISGQSNRNPLFDVEFSLQTKVIGAVDGADMEIPGLKLTSSEPGHKQTRFDVELQAVEDRDKINMMLTYSTALFRDSTAKDTCQHYIEILQQVLENKDTHLKDIKISGKLVAAADIINETETIFGF
jgi:amino acid adenylation domain-containing protein